MQWLAQAPANIALIKYMGKKEETANIPANPSLSYTLKNLLSTVLLESHAGKKDIWEPLVVPGEVSKFSLSKEAQERFIKHLQFLKNYFDYNGAFIIRSNNNFPTATGLASSASSFAALTKAAVTALTELTNKPKPSIENQAMLSRFGSGSSCRSFFSPWTLWEENHIQALKLPAFSELIHLVIIISRLEKKIPSTQAHQLVQTSKFYPERAIRANQRLKELLLAFDTQDWRKAYEICWQEFHDMNQLFLTCATPFSYLNVDNQNMLDTLASFWQKKNDGPLVTMDAGPNIHLLFRLDQKELMLEFKNKYLIGNYDVL